MHKKTVLIEHAIISLVSLFVLLSLIYLGSYFMSDMFSNPQRYFDIDLSPDEFKILAIKLLFIVSSVFISYAIYLILSSKTRGEIIAFNFNKSLTASLSQLNKLYEEAPVPYVLLNEDGKIYKPNKAALRFFGMSLNEIEGKNLFQCEPKEDSEKVEKLLRYYRSGVPINNEEIRIVTKNEQAKWVLLSIFKIKTEEPNRSGLATIFDITERKQLDQAKTEFVSLASHQLRTPVATVKWYLDMLQSGDLGELSLKQKDYLDRMHNVNEEMVSLIDTLLSISRIEIGTIKPDIKPTNVIDLAESVLSELSFQIQEKNLAIDKQYGENLKDIKSDPKLLRIVIQNLISNAVKYTPKNGSISIILKDSILDKSITVSDTGIGIPESQHDRIFTKLFRADNARKVDSQGTGLGLYLIKSLVETMGGSISFSSKENEGSTFIIKL